MSLKKFLHRAALASALLVPWIASAQDRPNANEKQGGAAAEITPGTVEGLALLHQLDQKQISLAQSGERARTPTVRELAKQIGNDQHAIDNDIQQFARAHQINLPNENQLSASDRASLKNLSTDKSALDRQQGTAIDRTFLQDIQQDTQAQLSRVEALAGQSGDPELKNLLEGKIKPLLEAHIKRAGELQGAAGGAQEQGQMQGQQTQQPEQQPQTQQPQTQQPQTQQPQTQQQNPNGY